MFFFASQWLSILIGRVVSFVSNIIETHLRWVCTEKEACINSISFELSTHIQESMLMRRGRACVRWCVVGALVFYGR